MRIVKIKNKLSLYIDKKYPNWDLSTAFRYLSIVKDVKKNSRKNLKILEVGSGEFGILPYLGRNIKITGVDVDFGNKSQKNLIMITGSAEKLPFENNSFDMVICVDILEHLPERIRKKAVFEMVRVAQLYI